MWRHLDCEHHAIYIKLKKGYDDEAVEGAATATVILIN
jgi:hypothetical protein